MLNPLLHISEREAIIISKKAKEPAPNVEGGDTTQPTQGSSKVATPDNKKLGEEDETLEYEGDELVEDEIEEEDEDVIELPETKAGMAKLIFDMVRSMEKDELDERYVDILTAILNEKEEAVEVDEESTELAREARARITSDDIDISDDVEALLSTDETLSEDFKANG